MRSYCSICVPKKIIHSFSIDTVEGDLPSSIAITRTDFPSHKPLKSFVFRGAIIV